MVFGKVLSLVLGVQGGFPLPIAADLNEMLSGHFELVGREFSVFLEDVFFRGLAHGLAYFLGLVVDIIFGCIPVVHMT